MLVVIKQYSMCNKKAKIYTTNKYIHTHTNMYTKCVRVNILAFISILVLYLLLLFSSP